MSEGAAWATPIHLEVRGPRDASLVVDGVDILPVVRAQSFDFHADARSAPVLTIHAVRPFIYDGPAEIRVMVDPLVTLVEFLNDVDPAELEAAALDGSGGLGGPSTGQCFLNALKAMARSALQPESVDATQ